VSSSLILSSPDSQLYQIADFLVMRSFNNHSSLSIGFVSVIVSELLERFLSKGELNCVIRMATFKILSLHLLQHCVVQVSSPNKTTHVTDRKWS